MNKIFKDQKPIAYGKVITTACFSIQAVGVGIYISYGVFFNPLMDEFGWSRAAISGASAAAFFVMGLFGILIGRLNDKIYATAGVATSLDNARTIGQGIAEKLKADGVDGVILTST